MASALLQHASIRSYISRIGSPNQLNFFGSLRFGSLRDVFDLDQSAMCQDFLFFKLLPVFQIAARRYAAMVRIYLAA